MMKEKEIKSLKKELAAQKRLTKELESTKVPTEELRKIKPLKEGMIAMKQEVIDEVLVVVEQFIGALQRFTFEEQKLQDIVVKRANLFSILDSRKPMVIKFEMTQDRRLEDVKFCEDYCFYLGVVNQIATRFQEVQKEVEAFNDKANTSLEQMDFQVKFIDDDATIRVDLVVAEVRHFLHSLIMTDDVNTYQTGSHLRHLLKAHA